MSTNPNQKAKAMNAQQWHIDIYQLHKAWTAAKDQKSRNQIISRLNFTTNTDELLEKYKNFPESIEFHIFPNHYRFGNQEGVIDKKDPSIRDFLAHLATEEIPPEMVEILYDGGIKLYEGCVIVKISDHRHVKESNANSVSRNPAADGQNNVVVSDPEASASASAAGSSDVVKKNQPRSYRTVLKPTPLSIYHDLLYISDRISIANLDELLLEMEAKFLPIIKPRLDLGIPLNPFQDKDLLVNYNEPKKAAYRDDSYLGPITKQGLHGTQSNVHGSEYEELMLYYAGRDLNNPGNNNINKFSRLRLVEQFRKQLELSKTQALTAKLQGHNVQNGQLSNNLTATQVSSKMPANPASSIPRPQTIVQPLNSGSAMSTPTNATGSMSIKVSTPKNGKKVGLQRKPPNQPGSAVSMTFPVSAQSSAANSPNMSKAQPKKRTYQTKKRKEAMAQQNQSQQSQPGGSPVVSNGIMSPSLQPSRVSTPGASETSFANFSPQMVPGAMNSSPIVNNMSLNQPVMQTGNGPRQGMPQMNSSMAQQIHLMNQLNKQQSSQPMNGLLDNIGAGAGNTNNKSNGTNLMGMNMNNSQQMILRKLQSMNQLNGGNMNLNNINLLENFSGNNGTSNGATNANNGGANAASPGNSNINNSVNSGNNTATNNAAIQNMMINLQQQQQQNGNGNMNFNMQNMIQDLVQRQLMNQNNGGNNNNNNNNNNNQSLNMMNMQMGSNNNNGTVPQNISGNGGNGMMNVNQLTPQQQQQLRFYQQMQLQNAMNSNGQGNMAMRGSNVNKQNNMMNQQLNQLNNQLNMGQMGSMGSMNNNGM